MLKTRIDFLILVPILFAGAILMFCSAGDSAVRPAHLPAKASWENEQKRWVIRKFRQENQLIYERIWNAEGGLISCFTRYSLRFKGISFWAGGHSTGFYNKKDNLITSPVMCRNNGCNLAYVSNQIVAPDYETARRMYENYSKKQHGRKRRFRYGKNGNYGWNRELRDGRKDFIGASYAYDETGRLKKITCHTPERAWETTPGDTNLPCGYVTTFNSDGTIKSRKNTGRVCMHGCGDFKPLIRKGLKYEVWTSALTLRSKPSTVAKPLDNLRKGAVVEILEDTQKIETISYETAPWVRVRTPDGKEGYIFGGFIRYVKWKSGRNRIDLLPLDLILE